MRRTSFETMNCSIARSLDVIGEWWTLLIVRDAFLGVSKFDDFQRRLGIARNVLAVRLDTLVEAGVLQRRVYDEARGRADYVLTEKGRALWPVMIAIRQWGDEWVLGRDAAPVRMKHLACGAETEAVLACGHCGERVQAGDVAPVAGPGLTDADLLAHVRSLGDEDGERPAPVG